MKELTEEEVVQGFKRAGTIVLSLSDALITGPDGEPLPPDKLPVQRKLVRSLSLQVVNTLAIILSVLDAGELDMDLPDSPMQPFVDQAKADVEVQDSGGGKKVLEEGECPHGPCEKSWRVTVNEDGEVEPEMFCEHIAARVEAMKAVPGSLEED